MASASSPRRASHLALDRGAQHRVLGAAVLAVVVLTYANAFFAPFVWDDHELIVDRARLEGPGALQQALFSDLFWGSPTSSSEYYRPLVTVSLIVDRALWGGNPAGYHLTNLLLHLVACMLLWQLTSRQAPPLVAAAATLLFGVFPRLTEAVTWVSGRGDLLAAGAVLAALCTLQSVTSRWWRGVLVGTSLLAGMLAKEVGLAGAVAVVILAGRLPVRSHPLAGDLATGDRNSSDVPRRVLGRVDLAAAVIAVAAYLALRMTADTATSVTAAVRLGPWRLALQLAESLGTFVWMVVTPWASSLQIGAMGVLDPLRLGLGVVTLAVVVGGAWRALFSDNRARLVYGLLGAAVSALAPALWVAGSQSEADAADRYLYLPLAMACAAAAIWIAPRRRARVVAIAGLVAATLLAPVTFARNAVWRDELGLWRHDAVRASRYSSVVHEAIGDIELRHHAYAAAERAYAAGMRALDRQLLEQHIDRRGSRSRLGGKLAGCWFELGELRRAAALSEHLARTDPEEPRHLVNLVKVAAADLDFARAEQLLALIETRFPTSTEGRRMASMVAEAQRQARDLPPPAADEALAVTVARARLLTLVHRVPAAGEAWWRVATAPDADVALVEEAAGFLATYGQPERAAAALQRLATMGLSEARLAGYRELLAQRQVPALSANVATGVRPQEVGGHRW